MPTAISNNRKLWFILLLSVCCSCFDNRQDKLFDTLTHMDKSLKANNDFIKESNNLIKQTLDDQLQDPKTASKAQITQPVAKEVYDLSADLLSAIEKMKIDLKREAGLNGEDEESYRKDNMTAVKRFFIKMENGKKLYKQLASYQEQVLNIDPGMRSQFKNKLTIVTDDPNHIAIQEDEFIKNNFENIPTQAAVCLLTKLQNNILRSENSMLHYCNNRTIYDGPRIDVYSLISFASNRKVKPGEEFEIYAGLGIFSYEAKPEITIDGKKVKIEQTGLSNYTLKAPATPGSYSVNINCDYYKQDGSKYTITKAFRYTVE